jgi:translation initiation factor IF-3
MRNRVNSQIRALNVRLIAEDGSQVGVVPLREAKRIAEESSMDLVEISPNADPPVVRVMDYGKFLFQESKQKALAKKKQKQIKVKEVKFRPGTDKADYEVKLRNLRSFLEEGDKVKVTVFFRGREITHQELGIKLLERVRADLAEHGKVEFFPRNAEGRQLVMVLSPKKK